MATSKAMTIATGSASAIEEVRGRWRTDEDKKLIRAVKEHGAKNWSVICTYIPGRSAKSCRLRWQNQLSPDVNHSPFTLEEDLEIVRHQSRLGNKWAAIARVLNAGRTENAVKNHWNCRIRKMMSSYSPPYDRRRAYHRYGYRRYHPRPLPSPLVLRSLSRRVISYESSHRFFPSNGGGEPHGSIDLTLRLAPPGFDMSDTLNIGFDSSFYKDKDLTYNNVVHACRSRIKELEPSFYKGDGIVRGEKRSEGLFPQASRESTDWQ